MYRGLVLVVGDGFHWHINEKYTKEGKAEVFIWCRSVQGCVYIKYIYEREDHYCDMQGRIVTHLGIILVWNEKGKKGISFY